MKVSLLTPQPLGLPNAVNNVEKGNKESFGAALNNALSKVNDLAVRSDELTKKMVAGEITDIHQVTIASQQASLALQLTVQVRNKVVEAYQEVSRMQI